jgi:hypothetical protein
MTNRLKIGQEVLIHGYIDEIRKDTVIIRNEGGYFGTVQEEISVNPQEPCDDAASRDFQIGDEVRIIGSDTIYDDCDVGWVIRNASERVKTMYVMRNDGSAAEETKAEWYKTGRHNSVLAEAIKDLSLITPQPKTDWIPVSERLPEDSELVLFSTKTDRVFEGRYFADNTDRQWYAFRDETFAWNNVVTAWMPLPEPYEPKESEDKEDAE